MRIFRKQQNMIETDPIIDDITDLALGTLDVTFNLYDKSNTLVTGSNVTLAHQGAGVYRAIVPTLTALVTDDYYAEMIIKDNPSSNDPLFYFYGPCSAIIRSSL